MVKRQQSWILAFAGLLMVPALAGAQSAGAIAGTARDTTGAVLPGVTVEVSSPALIEKVRSATTDSSGQYRIVDLRPGVYSATFSLSGFATLRREDVNVSLGFTAAVNAELKVGSLEETVTVTGQAALVDVQNVTQQQVMNREVVDNIPSGKIFTNLAVLVPGMVVAGSAGVIAQDVGGQSGFQFPRLQIHGSVTGDQQLYVDGYPLQILSTDGSATTTIPIDNSVEEYGMETSARGADSETGGVRVNLVPKDGGNVVRGAVSANYSNSDLQSDNHSDELRALGLINVNRAKELWAVSPSLGGPLMKDKLWFFTAWQRWRADSYEAGIYENANLGGWTYVPDLSRSKIQDQKMWGGVGRFSLQATEKNRFAFYYEYNDVCNCHYTVSPTAPESAFFATFPNKVLYANWTSPITNKLLLQAGFGQHKVDPYHLGKQPNGNGRSVVDNSGPFAGYRYGDVSTDIIIQSTVNTVKGAVSYVTGTHSVKVGMDMRISSSAPRYSFTPGNASFTFLNGRPNAVTYSSGPIGTYTNVRPNMGLYAQDQVTLRRLTINGGLRFDLFRTSIPAQTLERSQFRLQDFSFPAMDVLNWRDVNPRLGAAYDLNGDGRSAIKFSLGRYVSQEATTLTELVNPVSAPGNTRTWNDANGDFVLQGDPLNLQPNGELGPSSNLRFGQLGTITTSIDPTYGDGFHKRMYNWELGTSVQREVRRNVSVSAAYFYRWFGNFQVRDNTRVAAADFDPFCITTPADARLPGGGSQQICGLYDLNPTKLGQIFTNVTLAQDTNQKLHWNGFDFTSNARLGGGVILQGGVSFGSYLFDSCDAVSSGVTLVNPSSQSSFPNLNANDNPSKLYCRTTTPYQANVKMIASYGLPYGIQVSGTLQSLPGPEVRALYTARNAEILPSLGRNLSAGATGAVSVNLIEPGTRYGDRLNQLDMRLARSFQIEQVKVQAQFDIYNVVNGNVVLAQSNTYGTNGVAWLRPSTILPARLVKFGVQVNF